MSNDAAGAIGLIIIAIIYIAIIAFFIVCYWKIFSKAGFSGAMSLLMLVPIANIIALAYLAFAEWPALRNAHNPDTFS